MMKHLVDFNALLVRQRENVFSQGNCRDWIARIENAPREIAPLTTRSGPVLNANVRNNTRVIVDDDALAKEYWALVKPHVDETLFGWRAVGLNERFRGYRYGPQQRFAPHYDGSFVRNDRERSMLTLLFYLNDDFSGGKTEMMDFDEAPIVPKQGLMLLFQHPLLHQGCVVESGVKYVLRTDVMYRAP